MENKRKGLNRKAFPKFMLWVLGGAVFGFCAGLAGSILEDLNVAETVETRLAAVLTAVTLGGSLMGIAGMLFFIPLCSVVYALFRSYVKDRLVQRKVPAAKWRDPPPDPKQK